MVSRPSLFGVAVLLCALVGCTDSEGIRVVNEPKPAHPDMPDVPADQQKFRTLAAMIPQTAGEPGNEFGQWWFFKFSGPADVVEKHKPAFDALIATVRLTGEKYDPITWTLPPGWVKIEEDDDKKGMGRFATLKFGGKDTTVEISVSKVGGTILSNVNRWRKQMGLGEVNGWQVDAATTQRVINGRIVVQVDMAGPNEPPKGGGGPMMMGGK